MTEEDRRTLALRRLALLWLDEAARHDEGAAEAAGYGESNEADMHNEAARVYLKCADELLEAIK